MGLSARMGIEVVMRQVLFGAGNYHLVDQNFEPLPVSDCYFPIAMSRIEYIEHPCIKLLIKVNPVNKFSILNK